MNTVFSFYIFLFSGVLLSGCSKSESVNTIHDPLKQHAAFSTLTNNWNLKIPGDFKLLKSGEKNNPRDFPWQRQWIKVGLPSWTFSNLLKQPNYVGGDTWTSTDDLPGPEEWWEIKPPFTINMEIIQAENKKDSLHVFLVSQDTTNYLLINFFGSTNGLKVTR